MTFVEAAPGREAKRGLITTLRDITGGWVGACVHACGQRNAGFLIEIIAFFGGGGCAYVPTALVDPPSTDTHQPTKTNKTNTPPRLAIVIVIRRQDLCRGGARAADAAAGGAAGGGGEDGRGQRHHSGMRVVGWVAFRVG